MKSHKPKTKQILKCASLTHKQQQQLKHLQQDSDEIPAVGVGSFNPAAPFQNQAQTSFESDTSQKSLSTRRSKYRIDTYTDEEGHSFSRITRQESDDDAKVELMQEIKEDQGQETLNDLLDFFGDM